MTAVWRFFRLSVLVIAAAAGFSAPASAAGNSKYAAIVVHADSGDILFDRYSTQTRYPASLTKMMTLYLLFEEIEAGRLSLTSDLTASAQAAAQPPSKLGIAVGGTIDVETAIKALVVKSANDVAVTVADSISGSEWRFAQKMTEKARALGMTRTTFRNASGLPNSKQVTTARDLATLGRRLVQDFPQYFHYFATDKFTWDGKTYLTHNGLVRTFPGADGLKTGYTRVSGFNLATSVNRDGNHLIGVVLGGRSVRTRDAHMREILTTAFAGVKSNPSLIASLHRSTPTPRLKPTLLAALERAPAAPTVADSDILRDTIIAAAAEYSGADVSEDVPADDDAIGSLIAAAASATDDLNEFQGVRFAALTPYDGNVGEGDAEAATGAWNVQIGAYSTKELAQKELEAAALAGGLIDRARAVQPAGSDKGSTFFRARFTSMTAADAGEVCDTLRQRQVACFVTTDLAPELATSIR